MLSTPLLPPAGLLSTSFSLLQLSSGVEGFEGAGCVGSVEGCVGEGCSGSVQGRSGSVQGCEGAGYSG